MRLPAGTRIEAVWSYDNREENPRNPVIPPEAVSLGARVGSANVLLMCAPVDEEQTADLAQFSMSEVHRRQRVNQGLGSSSTSFQVNPPAADVLECIRTCLLPSLCSMTARPSGVVPRVIRGLPCGSKK